MTYLDYILIGIIILFVIIGFLKGFIKMVFELLSTIVSVIIAYMFYSQVSAWIIKNTGLYNFITDRVIQALNLKALTSNVTAPQDQIQFIQNLNLPGFIKNNLIQQNNPVIYDLLKATKLDEYIGGTIATLAINALSFVILFFIALFVLKILSHVFNIISKLPVIHQLNKLGGMAAGLIEGILLVWLICIVLSFIVSLQGDGQLQELINQSKVTYYFYNQNVILKYIADLTKTFVKLSVSIKG